MLFNSILPEASVTPRRISSIQMIAFGSVWMAREDRGEIAFRFCAAVFPVNEDSAIKMVPRKSTRARVLPVFEIILVLKSDNFVKPIHYGIDFVVRCFPNFLTQPLC